ncbi:MAG TPA: helix-turn-helix domain-containing protein [Pirellulales bacterium]|nr:helix-turn-helix domain-containing protein [Pirellulales bacterium]
MFEAKQSRTFSELVTACPTRPIRNDRELAKAHKTIEGLMDKPKLSRDEADYLEVLGMLVVKYEAALDPPRDVSQADMLAFYLEAKGVCQAEISRGTGISATTISNVRAGRRDFSRADVRRLCEYFHCQPAVWI